jgi:N-acyl-D-aspartate/D-glutamate deacylase
VDEATGKRVLPGFLDIHTYYDVEVLDGPSLPESLRHGVTTAMLGSCSLSTVYVGGVDAGDLFGRVEAIPRDHVIAASRSDLSRWRTTRTTTVCWCPTAPT